MPRPSCRLLRFHVPSRLQRRVLHTGTVTGRAVIKAPAASGTYDHATLRKIFDSHSFWKDFSTQGFNLAPSRKGLFQNHYLTHPNGFLAFSNATLEKCRKVVAKVVHASSVDELRSIPRDLDRLSDLLCRVLDVADFVRATHPKPAFQEAASQAYGTMFEYMNVLNTTPDLKTQLEKAVTTPEVKGSWNEEETMVAEVLLKDFSKSAIDLPQYKRASFVELSNDISQLGQSFTKSMSPDKPVVSLHNRQLKGMDPVILHASPKTRSGISIPTVGPLAVTALRKLKDEEARRILYIAGRISPKAQLQILESLLSKRARVAALSGYKSYAKMSLSDKLAKSPEAVTLFLQALLNDNKPRATSEINQMLRLKLVDSADTNQRVQIEAWDIEFYRSQLIAQQRSKSRRPDFMAAYFSLGTVMQGLSRLFSHLYGVRLVPSETAPGETWDPDVRRLDVYDEKEGHIAVLYCDLFARDGKNHNPAHFTLRCSRRISPAEIAEAAQANPALDPIQAATDGMSTARRSPQGDIYQLPAIALICDFDATPSRPQEPTLLSFRDVQTLFHEMGHAIHSFLGRTALQVVSGTRCATDLAELPSVLMEHFAADAGVLGLFARHWQTDAALPYEMVVEQLAVDRKGEGLETETQILLAMLDQAYHGELPAAAMTEEEGESGEKFDSTRVLHDVYDRHGTVREPRETSAQGMFGHLVEYGGTYYSYLFDRAIAGKIWKDVFDGGRNGGALSRERGERFRDEVLRWGGGRDGWTCLANVLGDDKLRDGGPQAMAEVGRWGLGTD
ncbi:MAG: hypothetical protein LQ351_000776 [Letrouitia transgressa]|nr:MAG: hypothetical protein LQ351_000776 [Letrouitia transgressa]